jgi:hypothetical protein
MVSRLQFAVVAGQADQLDAVPEEFRRAAFVGHDVRIGVAEDAAPGRREVGERQRIRGGAGRNQENGDLALKIPERPFFRCRAFIGSLPYPRTKPR